MTASEWIERSRRALAKAEARATAAAGGPPIATGFTNNVDLVATLDAETLRRLKDGRQLDLDGPRQTRGDTPDQLLTAILQCVRAGEGTDLPVANAATDAWLRSHLDGRPQIGGTSAQTANTLTRLGFPTLVHLTGCSAEQAAVFDVPALVGVPRERSVVPVDRAVRPDDPTMWHVVLEYPRGLPVEVNGATFEAPAPNRVIVSYDPVNSGFAIDPAFVDAVADPAHGVRQVLVSGYSQLTDHGALRRFITDTLEAVRRWQDLRKEMFVHVEVGAMPGPGELAEVVAAIGLDVTSIGMNQDELRDVVRSWGIVVGDVVPMLEAVHHRLMGHRFGLHTASYAMTLTAGDPEAERDALLFATLLASTRARIGRFPDWGDLHATLGGCEPNPEGLAMAEAAGAPDGIRAMGGDALVVVPAPSVPHPAGTIGLGDSFTAGLLAML